MSSMFCCMSISPSFVIQLFMVAEDRDRRKGHLLLEGECFLISCVRPYVDSLISNLPTDHIAIYRGKEGCG